MFSKPTKFEEKSKRVFITFEDITVMIYFSIFLKNSQWVLWLCFKMSQQEPRIYP